ncbi:hypothetical protein ACVRXE_03885 [Streptococcus porci]
MSACGLILSLKPELVFFKTYLSIESMGIILSKLIPLLKAKALQPIASYFKLVAKYPATPLQYY